MKKKEFDNMLKEALEEYIIMDEKRIEKELENNKEHKFSLEHEAKMEELFRQIREKEGKKEKRKQFVIKFLKLILVLLCCIIVAKIID